MVPANELGDQLGLFGREQLAADFGRAGDVCLQRSLRLHDGTHGAGRSFRGALDQPVGRGDRGHGIVEARLRSVAAPYVEYYRADAAANGYLGAHPVGPKTVDLALLQRLRSVHAEVTAPPLPARHRATFYFTPPTPHAL